LMVDIGPASSIPELTFTSWAKTWDIDSGVLAPTVVAVDEITGIVWISDGSSLIKALNLTDGSVLFTDTAHHGFSTLGTKSFRQIYQIGIENGTNDSFTVFRGSIKVFGSPVSTFGYLSFGISQTGRFIVICGSANNKVQLWTGS